MNFLRTFARKLRWSLIHRGLRDTLRLPILRLKSPPGPRVIVPTHPFDLQHQVDTSGLIGAVHLPADHPHDIFATAYYATPPSQFQAMLNRWQATPPQRPITEYTFIDIGCGKGRTVLLASQLPFKQVLGVELNPTLAQIATQNLKTWTTQPQTSPPQIVILSEAQRVEGPAVASPATILNADATEFTLPPTPCLVYLYNPFAPAIVARLIDHLERSFTAHPRPLDILYFTPDAGDLFAHHPNYTTLWSESIPISNADLAVEPVTAVIDQCTAYRRTL